ncbi:uncharacterized protein B0H18DRAFT_959979 [Fomitopsis serialis]|uniref:uncharacterized protein n=1 Tax=Fomitopsis serialis TaxID=139415 RepID=UPI0020074E44|nr:uncharacterized protein B0H18DRAFT_959979 [Neoantrodia serialis]KAH9914245.1 hypothetical protein B0H18DRAFT_959979 [Neoantrodia serialis]
MPLQWSLNKIRTSSSSPFSTSTTVDVRYYSANLSATSRRRGVKVKGNWVSRKLYDTHTTIDKRARWLEGQAILAGNVDGAFIARSLTGPQSASRIASDGIGEPLVEPHELNDAPCLGPSMTPNQSHQRRIRDIDLSDSFVALDGNASSIDTDSDTAESAASEDEEEAGSPPSYDSAEENADEALDAANARAIKELTSVFVLVNTNILTFSVPPTLIFAHPPDEASSEYHPPATEPASFANSGLLRLSTQHSINNHFLRHEEFMYQQLVNISHLVSNSSRLQHLQAMVHNRILDELRRLEGIKGEEWNCQRHGGHGPPDPHLVRYKGQNRILLASASFSRPGHNGTQVFDPRTPSHLPSIEERLRLHTRGSRRSIEEQVGFDSIPVDSRTLLHQFDMDPVVRSYVTPAQLLRAVPIKRRHRPPSAVRHCYASA